MRTSDDVDFSLLDAAAVGSINELCAAITDGANVNIAINNDGRVRILVGDPFLRSPITPAMAAAKKGHAGCLQKLIEFGAHLQSPPGAESLASLAIQGGHPDCLQVLIDNSAPLPDLGFAVRQLTSPSWSARIKADSVCYVMMAEAGAYPMSDALKEARKLTTLSAITAVTMLESKMLSLDRMLAATRPGKLVNHDV